MRFRRLQRTSLGSGAILALACSLAPLSAPAWARTPAEQVVSNVRIDIARGDCKAAAARLNKGLGEHYAEVQLLAGSMYENGACLKANWDRALHFYSLAFKNGQTEAAYRLAAGFAAPENGPDIASALWWASRVNLVDGDCLPSEAARNDADLFLKELKTWTDARVAVCSYLAGVMATIAAEVRYPRDASQWAVGGDVLITFKPGVPRIDLTLNGTEQYLLAGFYNGDRLWEQNNKKIGSAFVQTVRAAADHALQRFPKPDGIPADYPAVKTTFSFQMDDVRMPQFHD